MRILITRHTSTYQTETGFIESDNNDCKLSQRGLKEARGLLHQLGTFFPDVVVVSSLIRTHQTVKEMFPGIGNDYIVNKGLNEIDKGFEHFLRQHANKKQMTILEWEQTYNNGNNLRDRLSFKYPSGNCINEFIDVVIESFMDILKTYQGNDICIIAHNGSIKSILLHALEKGKDFYFHLSIPIGIWFELIYTKGAFQVEAINGRDLIP